MEDLIKKDETYKSINLLLIHRKKNFIERKHRLSVGNELSSVLKYLLSNISIKLTNSNNEMKVHFVDS